MLIGIKVKTINDESFHFNLEHDTKIYDVKTKLKEMTTIAEDRQRLIYKGRVLQNESVLEDYMIEEGHTIHMVSRPADYEALQQRAQQVVATSAASSSLNASLQNLSQSTTSLQTLLALSALSGAGDQAGAGAGRGPDLSAVTEAQSLEAIRQGLMTTHTFMSMSGMEHTYGESGEDDGPRQHGRQGGRADTNMLKGQRGAAEEDGQKEEVGKKVEAEDSTEEMLAKRTFYLGQWLDVKDTVNQWLEATVMDIDYEGRRVFVHYNGWPPRWDEWVAFSSDRVTPFRTRTANVTTSQASPMPSNVVASAPQTSSEGGVRSLVPELHHLVEGMLPLLRDAALLCTQDRQREQNAKGEEAQKLSIGRTATATASSTSTTTAAARGHMPWHDKEKQTMEIQQQEWRGGGGEEKDCAATQREQQQLARLTRQLAPLLDRLGRAMTDVAPHLLNLEASLLSQSPLSPDDGTTGTSNNTTRRTSGSETSEHQSSPPPPQSAMERLLESLSLGVSPLQRGGDSSVLSAPPYRPLVTTPAAPPAFGGLLGGSRGNHLDIHIHAIVAPTRGQSSVPGDSSSASTSSSSTSSSPPSPISSPAPPRPSATLPCPSTTMTSTSGAHEHMSTLTHDGDDVDNDDDSSEDDDSHNTPPPRSLLPEEQLQQQQRRQAWPDRSSCTPAVETASHSPPDRVLDKDRDALPSSDSSSITTTAPFSSSSSSTSLRDDIEELYDANFGEHFRRLHEEQQHGRGQQQGCSSPTRFPTASSRSTPQAAGARARVDHGCGVEKDEGRCGLLSATSSTQNKIAARCGTGNNNSIKISKDEKEHVKDNSNDQNFPMPSTYSHFSNSKKKEKSASQASAAVGLGGSKIDAVTLSNLEKEVALLAEKTQLQQQQQEWDAEEEEERRRRKNVSFVQRVRRSLSSMSSSSSRKKQNNKSDAKANGSNSTNNVKSQASKTRVNESSRTSDK